MAEANKERIFDEFVELVSVPCHTLKERQVFELLQQKLKDLGFVTQEDDAGKELGGECGIYGDGCRGTKSSDTCAADRAYGLRGTMRRHQGR